MKFRKHLLFLIPRRLVFALLAWSVASLGASSSAFANKDRLNQLQTRLKQAESNTNLLLQGYQGTGTTEGRVGLQKRLSDGQVNFLLGDYVRASIILLDAVENRNYVGQIGWYEAMYYLAESLYRNGNLQSATEYYKKLVGSGSNYASASLVRLLEIAITTNQFSWIDNFFGSGKFIPYGNEQAKIQYLRGKALYQQDKISEAVSSFRQVPQGNLFWVRAQYFLAIIPLKTSASQTQELPAAIQRLEQATKTIPAKEKGEAELLRDTLWMAIGRLYLEQSEFRKAIDAYQQIERTSEYFDQALYEIAWVYIRRAQTNKKDAEKKKEYERALQALDLLLAFLTRSAFFSRAQLLRGHLLLQLEQFSPAMENYNNIAKRYSTVYKEITQLSKDRVVAEGELYRALVNFKPDKEVIPSVIPREAIQRLSENEEIRRVVAIQQDIAKMRDFLGESNLIVQKLEAALQQEERLTLSPTLREGRLQAATINNELVYIQQELNLLEQSLVLPKLSSSERQEYEQQTRELNEVQKDFLRTPRTRQDIIQRSRQVGLRIEDLTTRLHKLSIKLDYIENVYRSVKKWLLRDTAAAQLTKEQRDSIEKDAEQIQQSASELRKERETLQNQLDLARIELGYEAPGQQDTDIRKKYQDLLQKQQDLLNRLQGRLSGEERETVQQIKSLLLQLRTLQGQLAGFSARLNRLIATYAQKIRVQLQQEKVKLSQYQQELNQLQTEAEQLSRDVIFNGFLRVQQEFYRLVLRADVGVIDVVWKEKQAVQDNIQKVSKERNSELRVLDSEFKDLLNEVK